MTLYAYTLLCPEEGKYFLGVTSRKIKNPCTYFHNEHNDLQYLQSYEMSEVVTVEIRE